MTPPPISARCPFCGATDTEFTAEGEGTIYPDSGRHRCTTCQAEGPWCDDEEESKAKWFTPAHFAALCGSPGAGEAGWIAVAERLPEAGVDVLTFDSEGLCDVDRIEAGTEREWEFSIAPNHITHWMKLPSPPAARAVMK